MVTEADHAQWTVDDVRPYADTVLHAFGPERLMFGSDWPVSLLAAPYGAVLDAAELLTRSLDADAHAEVFAGTARRVYGLPGG